MSSYLEKKENLQKKMSQYAAQDVMVAFSGGADSSLLLKLACEAAQTSGRKVYAATVQTRLHPAGEIEEARRICQEMGAVHVLLTVDELKEAGIMKNPIDRCYLCKKHLFQKILSQASELGADIVLEGTNEDDLHVYRPGIRALKELGILSPLAEAGLTKAEVRELAGEYGLSVATKPAAPCLATRFPYGTELSYEKIEQVEKGESFLKSFVHGNVRLRVHEHEKHAHEYEEPVHGAIARIEVDREEFNRLAEHSEEIVSYLKKLGYQYITLDMEGFRSGSMDIGLVQEK